MPTDFTNKKWTVAALKAYLRQNGQEKLSKKNKAELIKQAISIEKAKALIDEETSLCSNCNKQIDDCICERCDECFETLKDCFCIEAKERREKLQKMKQMMNPLASMINKFQQVTQPKSQQLPLTQQNLKKFTETTSNSNLSSVTNTASITSSKKVKKVIKKIIKKKPQKQKAKTVISINLDSIDEEKDEIDIETELQISALKIKIKLFIADKIENKKSVQTDVFSLMELILLKHKIILKEEEKTVFPRIFQRIYKESKEKQKKILKDIVIYLVDCDPKSFDSFM
jgi:hypothetical protein